MPSESTGNKYLIKSIKVYQDHVTLSFIKKRDKLKISKEAYLSSYLYVAEDNPYDYNALVTKNQRKQIVQNVLI